MGSTDEDAPAEWPTEGMSLYELTGTGRYHACLNFGGDEWHGYANGFRLAGRTLVQHVIDTDRHHDYLVFPIVFNYRQYLELQMKDLIQTGKALIDEPGGFEKIHDLDRLWWSCRRILVEVFGETPDGSLAVTDRIIAELAEIDGKSMAFRYPTDKQGERSLPEDLTRIDLVGFAETIEAVANMLAAADMGISVYLENKAEGLAMAAELEAEVRAEMAAEYRSDVYDEGP